MPAEFADDPMCKWPTPPARRQERYEIHVTRGPERTVTECVVDHFSKAKFATLQAAKALYARGEEGTVSLVGGFEMERFVVCARGILDDRHGARKRNRSRRA